MKKLFVLLLAATVLSSCSVVMAAKKEGVSVERLQACHTRGQIIATGAQVVSSERLVSGELIEVYQILKERGSAARAFMHGALDVSTLGLWEVFGTPIEATVDKKEFYSLKIYYDTQDIVQKIELI